MKHTLCILTLLLLAVTAHAQASRGSISGTVKDDFDAPLPVGVSAVHTMPGGEVFTIEVATTEDDSLFVLKSPMVKTSRGEIALTLIEDSRLSLDCPKESEAVFFADESRQYQMGVCASTRRHTSALVHVNGTFITGGQQTRALVHVNGTFGRGTVGVDMN